jgi:hypothetical protein
MDCCRSDERFHPHKVAARYEEVYLEAAQRAAVPVGALAVGRFAS